MHNHTYAVCQEANQIRRTLVTFQPKWYDDLKADVGFFGFVFALLEIEHRAMCMLGKCCTVELQSQWCGDVEVGISKNMFFI